MMGNFLHALFLSLIRFLKNSFHMLEPFMYDSFQIVKNFSNSFMSNLGVLSRTNFNKNELFSVCFLSSVPRCLPPPPVMSRILFLHASCHACHFVESFPLCCRKLFLLFVHSLLYFSSLILILICKLLLM